ncbi:MAG: tetratricopeptide repeat protein [Gammaproteobacteria bacterium]|nr:tetratricopeptide repeat protein [Gammaproteobacteria bacterium]
MAEERIQRRLAAIVSTDMVGYSRLMEADEAGTLAGLRAVRTELIDPKIAEYRGRIVKTTGDGMLIEFASVTDAVQSCVEVQQALSAHNADIPHDRRIQFRIGINLGEIIIEGDDIYGTGVNVAARLEPLAETGGIVISGSVYDQIRSIMSLRCEDMGEQSVKNISTPVRCFAVRAGGESEDEPVVDQPIATAKSDKPTIAVLPFENISGDTEQEYFADGMTEDIMTALSKNRWLLVSARNSTFAYKGQSVDIRRVGQELNANFVLEGSVRKAGNRVRITAQLIDASDGNHLWAERFDRDLTDIFEVQDEITAMIAARIEPELGAAQRERVQLKTTNKLDAWETYHLALSLMYQYTKDSNAEAQRYFQQAIEIDPDFGPAHAGLAYTMFLSAVYFGSEATEELLDTALKEAETAIALDDRDAMSYFVLGRIHLIRREYDLSISAMRTAVDLNACLATAYCGLGDSLSYSGRVAEAIPQFEEAIRLSPHDPRKWAFLLYGSLALMLLERYDEAVDWAAKAIAVPNATFWPHAQLVAVYSYAGRSDEAHTAAENLLRKEPEFSANQFAHQFLFYHEDPSQIDRYSQVLCAAGLPE